MNSEFYIVIYPWADTLSNGQKVFNWENFANEICKNSHCDEVINLFIEEFGTDKFQQLREVVLQSIVPDAQTEGMIAGDSGGMDDEVMGMIGEEQPVAVSPGEYIVAADVVSGLGDGNSDAGADVLDEMMQNVRNARSGGRQPSPIDKSAVMPA